MPSLSISMVECRLKYQLSEGTCLLNTGEMQLLFLFFEVEVHVNKSFQIFFFPVRAVYVPVWRACYLDTLGSICVATDRPGQGWVMQRAHKSVNRTLGPHPCCNQRAPISFILYFTH